jgi:hypothetical protein
MSSHRDAAGHPGPASPPAALPFLVPDPGGPLVPLGQPAAGRRSSSRTARPLGSADRTGRTA